MDSSNQDGQRTSGGRFIHTTDKPDRLNPIFGVARASGIGELRTSEDTVPFLEAILKGRLDGAMRMASLHVDPVEKTTLLESIEELQGLPDGRNASGKDVS